MKHPASCAGCFMNLVVDLSNYQKIALPDGWGCGICQHIARVPSPRAPYYTVYTDEACAVSEIVYYRLCKKLGLKCVKSDFGTNLVDSKQYVSVSEFSPLWKQHGNLSDPSLLIEQVHVFYGLMLLTGANFWHDEQEGYLVDNTFIKANNGVNFFSIGLGRLIRRSKQDAGVVRAHRPSVTNFLSETKSMHKSARDICQKVSELTNEDFQEMLEMPEDWDSKLIAKEYLSNELQEMRKYASSCFSALCDMKKAKKSKGGNSTLA